MFSVTNKDTGVVYPVYDVVPSKGYPHFLIYQDGQWKYVSAKYFRPSSEGETL